MNFGSSPILRNHDFEMLNGFIPSRIVVLPNEMLAENPDK